MGGYKKANNMGRVPKEGNLHKKGKKKNLQKKDICRTDEYYYTEFINTF